MGSAMYQQTLFMEPFSDGPEQPTNVASVPQRSPFRYPGGKTWLVPRFRRWMKSLDRVPRRLIDPFAGGGILPLTAAFENLAEKIILVELDAQIAAVWQTILSDDAAWLSRRIVDFELTPGSLQRVLESKPCSTREHAFQTILRNRTAHGGILAGGAGLIKNGENGKGLLSRWYPRTLAGRISAIQQVAHKIQFRCMDGLDMIKANLSDPFAVFFIDPPYTAGGKKAGARLYDHCEIDHALLFGICANLVGDFLMTYDNAKEVHALAARHGFETRAIAMKNSHHAVMSELLVGKNLDWMI